MHCIHPTTLWRMTRRISGTGVNDAGPIRIVMACGMCGQERTYDMVDETKPQTTDDDWAYAERMG